MPGTKVRAIATTRRILCPWNDESPVRPVIALRRMGPKKIWLVLLIGCCRNGSDFLGQSDERRARVQQPTASTQADEGFRVYVRTKRNRRSLHCATPDFLLSLVALAILMRLSLTKAAHVAMSSAARQEIRLRSVEKHFQERSAELQIPPLRSPDFLWNLVALVSSVRLSLRKAACVAVVRASR